MNNKVATVLLSNMLSLFQLNIFMIVITNMDILYGPEPDNMLRLLILCITYFGLGITNIFLRLKQFSTKQTQDPIREAICDFDNKE